MRARTGPLGGAVLLLSLLGLALTGCSTHPLTAPAGGSELSAAPSFAPAPAAGSDGEVVVAYPEEPASWTGGRGDVAAADLQAVWGLPLLRIDPAGQLRSGLATDWRIEDGDPWAVVLDLAVGRWSDGAPVTSGDVVATLRAAAEERPREFAPVRGITAPDATRVRLEFAAPYARWPDLLVSAGSVLPEAVLSTAGRQAYGDAIPVSGGRFALADYVPGRSARFVAHPDGPLGPPAAEAVEVLFTPRYETALGLLEDGRADVALGYTALNAAVRAEDVEGVEAEAPMGGTWVGLEFRAGGPFDGAGRRADRAGIAGVIDVGELVEGLLGPAGDVATSPWPRVPSPRPRPDASAPGDTSLVVLLPASNEVLAFTGRAIERDLTARQVATDLVYEPSPRFAEVVDRERDAALVLRRTTPWPSLTRWLPPEDDDMATAADAAGWPSSAARNALRRVTEDARVVPLYRVGVLHAWRGIDGLRPSAWPGTGFWNVGEWRTAPDAPS